MKRCCLLLAALATLAVCAPAQAATVDRFQPGRAFGVTMGPAPCALNLSRLTLCDERSVSLAFVHRDSAPALLGYSGVGRCYRARGNVYDGCWAREYMVVDGIATGVWWWRTVVTLRRGRSVCANWDSLTGSRTVCLT
ncbi:MAG TPA: hypothetical protein VG275_07045 [Solirubrobacteraceae bacterium]|jgi:hypothetical protein|nr:hypothetical protein [Solirubrobacteraceae bacterium]